MIGNNEKDNEKAEKVAEACLEVTDGERCQAAFKIWNCIEKEAEKQELKLF